MTRNSTIRLTNLWPSNSRSNWNLEMLFLRRGENRSTRRKTSRSKDKNQQQTQPTFDAESGNWWEACVGGKCSTTAPSLLCHLKLFDATVNHCTLAKPFHAWRIHFMLRCSICDFVLFEHRQLVDSRFDCSTLKTKAELLAL